MSTKSIGSDSQYLINIGKETSISATPAMLTETELWISFKTGNETAFIHIYKEYATILFNYGCQFTPDQELVKDCLQDFFIYLRKNRGKVSDSVCIKMYLLKSFKRRVIDYVKKDSTKREKNEEYLFYQFSTELSSEALYIDGQIQEEQTKKLNKALKGLSVKEREAIYYFYYESLSYEQIAELLNFSHVSSARRLIYRALFQLRKLIVIYYLILIECVI